MVSIAFSYIRIKLRVIDSKVEAESPPPVESPPPIKSEAPLRAKRGRSGCPYIGMLNIPDFPVAPSKLRVEASSVVCEAAYCSKNKGEILWVIQMNTGMLRVLTTHIRASSWRYRRYVQYQWDISCSLYLSQLINAFNSAAFSYLKQLAR
jgi:hypothetical protein